MIRQSRPAKLVHANKSGSPMNAGGGQYFRLANSPRLIF